MEITIPFKTLLKLIPFSAPGKELSMAKHQWSTKPEGSASWSHLSVLSQGLGRAGETPAGPSPALSWQRRWGAPSPTGEGIHPRCHSSLGGKSRSCWNSFIPQWTRGLLLDVAEAPKQESLRKKKPAVLSPAIKAVSEDWICVGFPEDTKPLHADPILAHLRVQPTKSLLVQLIPGSTWGTDSNIWKQSHSSSAKPGIISSNQCPISAMENRLLKAQIPFFISVAARYSYNTHGCSLFN